MTAINSNEVEGVLQIMKQAKSDNEKFAAMLIIAKAVKPETLPEEDLKKLLNSIGLIFPHRLLATACGCSDDNGTKEAYASIAVSVLKLHCICESTRSYLERERTVPLLLKTLKMFCDSNNSITDDCVDSLVILINSKMEVNPLSVLHALISIPSVHIKKYFPVLEAVIKTCPEVMQTDEYYKMIEEVAALFKTKQETIKFDICKILSNIIRNLPDKLPLDGSTWLHDIMLGLSDILSSKVTAEQRQSALVLTSEVLSILGLQSVIIKSLKDNFIVMLTRLACIEIGLFYRKIITKPDDVFFEQGVVRSVTSCFKITEMFCEAIAQFEENESGSLNDALTFEEIRLTQPALSDVAGTLKEYISELLKNEGKIEPVRKQLLHLSIRMLGCWMNIEYNVASPLGLEITAVLPTLLKYAWSAREFHLLKFVYPAVMKVCELSSPGELTVDLIFEVICCILESLLKCENANVLNTEEWEVLHLNTQCIIGMCTPQFKPSSNCIKSVCKLIGDITAGVQAENLDLVSKAYLYALTTIWLNLFPATQSKSDPIFKGCLDFLFEAFDLSKTTYHVQLIERYQNFWTEIAPLWHITLYEAKKYCKESAQGKRLFMISGWSTIIQDLSDKTVANDSFHEVESFLELT